MKEIVRRFLNNECSREEVEHLITHLRSGGTATDLPGVEEVLAKLASYQTISETHADRMVHAILDSQGVEMPPRSRKINWRMAASVIFLILSAVWVYHFFQDAVIERRTAFGEVKTVVLPDGSSVVLNGNSKLSYPSDWSKDSIRAVSVEGEAFFSVRHTEKHTPFIVSVNDEFSIRVLGTKFNVLHRRGRSNVVLNEGSVKVTIRRSNHVQQITIKPGEAITFLESNKSVEKAQVQPDKNSSWKNAKLILDNTLMKDVIPRIEDTYGVHVQVSDPSILSLKLWGTVPCNNLDNLIRGIEASFNLQVLRDGDSITITKSLKAINPTTN